MYTCNDDVMRSHPACQQFKKCYSRTLDFAAHLAIWTCFTSYFHYLVFIICSWSCVHQAETNHGSWHNSWVQASLLLKHCQIVPMTFLIYTMLSVVKDQSTFLRYHSAEWFEAGLASQVYHSKVLNVHLAYLCLLISCLATPFFVCFHRSPDAFKRMVPVLSESGLACHVSLGLELVLRIRWAWFTDVSEE